MDSKIVTRLRRISLAILATATLASCTGWKRCPEGTHYERGKPQWIYEFDVPTKSVRLVPVYRNAQCLPEDARRG